MEVGNVSSAHPYVVSGTNDLLSNSDPRSVGYNVEARYGRARAEREQRRRRHDEQEQRISSLQVKEVPSQASQEPSPNYTNENLEAKFFAEFDQNSLAAKTLRIAQATLRGESAPRRTPSSNNRNQSLSSSTSRLLARHQTPSSDLPKAQLRTKRHRPDISGPETSVVDQDSDNFVVI